MSVIQIRNPWLRRATLIVAIVPIVVSAFIFGTVSGWWQVAQEIGPMCRNVWRGRRNGKGEL